MAWRQAEKVSALNPLLIASLCFVVVARADAETSVSAPIAVPTGPLDRAIQLISEQTDTVILARSDQIAGLESPSLNGIMSIEDALHTVLSPHGLTFSRVEDAYAVVERSALAPIQQATHTPIVRQKRPANSMPVSEESELRNDVVLVTDFRSSNAAGILDKRRSALIEDGVNQDSITLLPDLTISDVARRIPGVSSIPEDGTATPRQIEASQNVLIRGLDSNFIQTTIDGLPFASATENDRATNLSLIPPTAIARVEAIKTLSAQFDPHGLSGRLNLETANALDSERARSAVRVSIGHNSTAGDVLEDHGPNLRADVFQTWRNERGTWGASIAGSFEQFYSTSADERPGGESGTYLFYQPGVSETVNNFADSDGLPSPRRNQLYLFENEQRRGSTLAKLEFFPNHDLQIASLAGLFWQDEQETRHEHLVIADPDVRPVDQTEQQGLWTRGSIESGVVYQPEETLTSFLSSKLSYRPTEQERLKLAVALSRADVDVTRNMSKFIIDQTPSGRLMETAFGYRVTPEGVVVNVVEPAAANEASNYRSAYIRERRQDIRQDLLHFDGSYARTFASDSHEFTLEFGAAQTFRDQSFDRFYIEGDVFDTEDCDQADVRDCPLATFDNYVVNERFSTTDPNVSFLLVNDQRMRSDWLAQGQPITNDRSDNSVNTDYEFSEQVSALYGRAVWGGQNWRLETGLRVDKTDIDVDLFQRDRRLPDMPQSAQYVPVSRAYRFETVLPSVLLNYSLKEDVLVRAAYTKTLGRPNISDLTPGESVGVPDGGEIVIRRGNPDLKPLASNNLDLSIEYYFDKNQSLLAAGVFYKSVEDLIFRQTTRIENFEFEGQQLDAIVTQPINTTDASLYGLELVAKKDFTDSLPEPWNGLVIDTSLTWTDSEFTYFDTDRTARNPGGWVNQPDFIFNFQASYERNRIGAKVAYNYVGEYLSNILADTGDLYDTYAQSRDVFDLQFRYQLFANLSLIAEVQNLTEEDITFTRRFPFGDLLATRADRGRVTWLGLSWRPG